KDDELFAALGVDQAGGRVDADHARVGPGVDGEFRLFEVLDRIYEGAIPRAVVAAAGGQADVLAVGADADRLAVLGDALALLVLDQLRALDPVAVQLLVAALGEEVLAVGRDARELGRDALERLDHLALHQVHGGDAVAASGEGHAQVRSRHAALHPGGR